MVVKTSGVNWLFETFDPVIIHELLDLLLLFWEFLEQLIDAGLCVQVGNDIEQCSLTRAPHSSLAFFSHYSSIGSGAPARPQV